MRGIKRLKSGNYQARYFAGYDAKGKRIYPSQTFTTQRAAIKWLTAKHHQKDLGQYVAAGNLTVSAWMDRWLETLKQRARENTIYAYEGFIRNYIKPKIGNIKLQNLRPHDVEQLQTELAERLAVKTIQTVRIVLNSACKKAVRLNLIGSNPVSGTDAPKGQRREMRSLSREEAIAFLRECKPDRFGVYFSMALQTGLRPEEMKAVKWANLDLLGQRGAVHVREALLSVPGCQKFVEPKSKNGIRTVTFPAGLVSELNEHRKRQLEEIMLAGKYYKKLDLVFPTRIGTPLNRTTLEKHLRDILKRVGVTGRFRQYDLRHSFVTLSLLAGVDIKTVSSEAGHSTTAFTYDHYAHVLKVMQESASDKREALFGGV